MIGYSVERNDVGISTGISTDNGSEFDRSDKYNDECYGSGNASCGIFYSLKSLLIAIMCAPYPRQYWM